MSKPASQQANPLLSGPALFRCKVQGKAFVLPAYFLISLLATWPLVTHLAGWAPGLGDWGQNLWALWWTRHALLSLEQLPFFTHYLFYPEGVTLLFHPLDVADGLLALPLYGLLGGDVTYNLLILLSFVLGGWGAYLLALYLTRQRGASFVAGLIFALSPYHLQRVDLGHLNLSTLQWIPFYILFALKFIRQGQRRAAVWAVFFLVFMALHSWYYVVYCGLLTLLMVFWPAKNHPAPFTMRHFLQRAGRITLILLAAGFILTPLLWPMFQLLSSTTLLGEHNPLRHSVDLLSFWTPGPPSTWAGWFKNMWTSYAAQNREPGASAYLGYTALGLSIIGLMGRYRRREVGWWLTAAVIFTVLALGPQPQFNGQIFNLTLPYRWLTDLIPAFTVTGIPGRFVVITSLALAMLAAYGLTTLLAVSGQRRAIGRWLWLAVVPLIILEYLAVPVRLTSTQLNDFYYQMAADTASYAVVDIKWDANFLLHAQTVHGKPLVGGWLARLPQQQAVYLNQGGLDRSFLYLLLGPEGTKLTDPAAIRPAIQSALAERQVRYIIDHDHQAEPFVAQFTGWPVVYEGDKLVVYGDPAISRK